METETSAEARVLRNLIACLAMVEPAHAAFSAEFVRGFDHALALARTYASAYTGEDFNHAVKQIAATAMEEATAAVARLNGDA